MFAASTDEGRLIQLCGFVLGTEIGTSLKLITLLLHDTTFNSKSSTSSASFLEISFKGGVMKIKN